MSYFAEVVDGVVVRVIVADQSFIDSGVVGDPKSWKETSIDTLKGENQKGEPLRKNYAGPGYTYDEKLDAFLPPQPFPSWSLDSVEGDYNPPKPLPIDAGSKLYAWDEQKEDWADAAVSAEAGVLKP